MLVRGKWCRVARRALDGMNAERPPISDAEIEAPLEEPDHDDGNQARKRIGRRTIIVYYREEADTLVVRAVSATRSRMAP